MRRTKNGLILTIALLVAAGLVGCSSGEKSHNESKNAAKDRWQSTRGALLYSVAQQQFEDGELDKAEKTVAQAMSTNPEKAEYHEMAGRIAMERGQLERAYYLVEHAVKLNPQRSESHYLMGVILQRWQRYEGALTSYEAAYSARPDQPDGLLAAAEMLVQLDRSDEAVSRLEEKLVYFEHNSAIRFSLGRIYLYKRDYPNAIRYFREAQVMNPDDSVVLEHLALAEYSDRQYPAAIDHLQQILKTDQGSLRDDLRVVLGDCYLETKQPVDARRLFLEVSQRTPNDAGIWLKLAQAAWIVEDDARVRQASERLIALAPTKPEGYVYRGMIEQKAGNMAAAIASFEQAVTVAPNPVGPLLLKGVALERAGDRTAAAAAYRQVLEIDPNDPRAQKLLAGIPE